MMKFRTNNINNLIFVLFITSITLFSCRRKEKVIGPELFLASSNFKLTGNSFKFNNKPTVKFANSGNTWFNASFNEKVQWQIKIKGTQTKAYKIITGTSNVLDQSTSLWTGTQSGIYFFKLGEKAIAELTVSGSNEKWYDTTTISSVKGKMDYGPDALIWYDMSNNMAVTGLPAWYSYFDTPWFGPVPHVAQWADTTLSALKDPVQGLYRSMLAKSMVPNTFWVGGFGQANIDYTKYKYGFSGASLNEVYLNFYIRRKSSTTPSMGITINSLSAKTYVSRTFIPKPAPGRWDSTFTPTYTSLGYTVNFPIASSSSDVISKSPPDGWVFNAAGGGTGGGSSTPDASLGGDSQSVVSLIPAASVTDEVAEGWSLVSIRLDQMSPGAGPPFDPSNISSVAGSLGTADLTGFDIDFIVFTRGVPFNQLLDQIK
jgi:hypothetical protein